MVVCNAHYRFLLVDVGDTGRHGGVFSHSTFGQVLECGNLSLPPNSPLTGTSSPALPYVIVGDVAFPSRNTHFNPIWERIWMHHTESLTTARLRQARRVIENTFSVLAACW